MKITFTNLAPFTIEQFNPQPAYKVLPEWYKKTESYTSKERKPVGNGEVTHTIKKCMPVFDVLTTGYILFTYTDIYVSQKEGQPFYEWPSLEPLSWHPVIQAELHPKANGAPFPKIHNVWSIKTPKGYSCHFVPPLHHDNKWFTIFPGIIDTDNYTNTVNLPFTLNDVNFEGLIPAGTPMAQVIPFKRESWEMEYGNEKDYKIAMNQKTTLRHVFFDSYKNNYWNKKEYK
jgi:hypothetical protein